MEGLTSRYVHVVGEMNEDENEIDTSTECRRTSPGYALSDLPAVVLSDDYHLGPEHRLPAAINDAAAAVSWLRGQNQLGLDTGAHSWLTESANFTRVFVTGESSGANMAHHVAVMHGSGLLDLSALHVSGGHQGPLVANPFGSKSPDLEPVDLSPVLVVSVGREILCDRVLDYATRLKEMRKWWSSASPRKHSMHSFLVNHGVRRPTSSS
ncbi:hypothetical protein PR202_ga25551 [Eleusine coracana subsp. coracana]|uniref:Alpha/beta hydrolase fold-3 domain-containing protein n=1 Tax=Eleusine coracana subsp. coracana TaxID=191504 RepID=A0AAV5DBN1_ELECO|nr:hypothetical protein PR202_ga25551 [Eleusine coracana subsp. coracana]